MLDCNSDGPQLRVEVTQRYRTRRNHFLLAICSIVVSLSNCTVCEILTIGVILLEFY